MSLKIEGKRFAALFIVLFLLFFIIRFPLKEVKTWAISRAAGAAQLDISLRDSSFLFPVGIEFEQLVFAKSGFFVSPELDSFRFKINPLSLFGNKKELSFHIINGGSGSGNIVVEKTIARASIKSDLIDIGGFKTTKGLSIEKGTLGISGELTASADYMKGEGSLDVRGSDLFIKGINPFIPELPVKAFSAKIEKEAASVRVKELSLEVEGLAFNGGGSVNLAKPLGRSSLDFNGKIDLFNSKEGPLSGIISMIRGMTGEKESFTVEVSGMINKPDFKIDGKRLF